MLCSEAENASTRKLENRRILLRSDNSHRSNVLSSLLWCCDFSCNSSSGKESEQHDTAKNDTFREGIYKDSELTGFMRMLTNEGMAIYLLQEDGFTAQADMFYEEELNAKIVGGTRSIGIHSVYKFVYRNIGRDEIKIKLGCITKLISSYNELSRLTVFDCRTSRDFAFKMIDGTFIPVRVCQKKYRALFIATTTQILRNRLY